MAGGTQFSTYQDQHEDGCPPVRDSGRGPQGVGSLQPGLQPGEVGNDRIGTGAGRGSGSGRPDRRGALADRVGARGRCIGAGGQPVAPRPGRAPGREATPEAILQDDQASSSTPQGTAEKALVTIFVAFYSFPFRPTGTDPR